MRRGECGGRGFLFGGIGVAGSRVIGCSGGGREASGGGSGVCARIGGILRTLALSRAFLIH